MRTLNNLSTAFHKSGSSKTFLVSLKPDPIMEAAIDQAEKAIRAYLGEWLPKRLQTLLPPGALAPKPKFRRQGSRAYATLNDPDRNSIHFAQADSDIGLYLPMELLKEATSTPQVAAEKLRGIVETALRELAKVKGWKVTSKRCCIRIQVAKDAHVDVTTYAIPEAEYRLIVEATALNFRKSTLDSVAFSDDEITWEEIPATAHLATTEGWIRSDAKAVNQKVENTALLKGAIYKRVVRFIKALRDFLDDEDGPCSIAITLIVADHLDDRVLDRDDLAVYSLLGEIADGLFRKLSTPGNEDVDILGAMTTETRYRLAQRLRDCQEVMRRALFDLPLDQAHAALQEIFGSRFPEPQTPDATVSPAVSISAPIIISRPNPVKAVAPQGNAKSS